MVTKETIIQVVYEQRERTDASWSDAKYVPRLCDQALIDCNEVLIITGIRRCGKSVLLRQIQSMRTERDYYINFDDERLVSFGIDDFAKLDEVFHEEFGDQHTYYFDEIQNVIGWERFVDRLYASGNKVFVTGSNAHLLSREMGTMLTGRHVTLELYPFSFGEYLTFRNVKLGKRETSTTQGKATITRLFREYLEQGGFPQYVRNQSVNYLQSIYSDIIYRDVIVRNKLNKDLSLREMIYYIASNVTHPCTANSIAKNIGMKQSDSIGDWLDMVEQTYLIHRVYKYSHKVGVQLRSPQKLYFIDNALARQVGFNLSNNIGAWLENAVAIELMRRGNEFYYHDDPTECDFIVRQYAHIADAIQVSASVETDSTRTREIKGLLSAMNTYRLDEGKIITVNEEEELHIDPSHTIHIIPCWKWMLDSHLSITHPN